MKKLFSVRRRKPAGFRHLFPAVLTIILLMLSLSACGISGGGAGNGSSDHEGDADNYSTTVYAMDIPIDLTAWGPHAEEAVKAAAEEIQRIDSLLSVTNPDSQIGQLNARTNDAVSGETLEVIKDSIRLSDLTGGSFNITIYPIVRAWGFTTGGEYRIPSDDEISGLLSHIGMDKFSLSDTGDDAAAVTFSDAETMLDTGAITKGYASDKIYSIFDKYGVETALCSLGGNIITKGIKTDGSQWKVGITDPFNPDDYCFAVSVDDKFLVTSGGYERYFKGSDGTRYIHIMDPETGRPVDNDLESVTIISDHGAEADALSTALFVKGRDDAIAFWKNCKDLDFEMVLIDDDKTIWATEGIADSCTAVGSYPLKTINK